MSGGEVKRYSWHAARQVANAPRTFVDASDHDALAAELTRTQQELRKAEAARDALRTCYDGLLTKGNEVLAERDALAAEAERLRAELVQAQADAERYRQLWRDPISPWLDEIGLQLIRYSKHEAAHGKPFNKAWCDEQLDAAFADQTGNERLRGIKPELPPLPPNGTGTPRYGLRWNGPEHPLAVPMDDGYWTPWHLAEAQVATLSAENSLLRGELKAASAAGGCADRGGGLSTLETCMTEFREFQKIPRLFREVIVTEKIDGTNACVVIGEDGSIAAQSRSRTITPQDDNYGFAKWVETNADELRKLGPGYHYGEWWGQGINRNYGLKEKRFSLFNVSRWEDSRPACCHVVPVLYRGSSKQSFWIVEDALNILRNEGSKAAPGFMKPEGVIAYHVQGNLLFKATLEKDEEWKGKSK